VAILGEAGENLDRASFIQSINRVSPSLIRTEADEVTYGLHIIARFELEAALFEGSLKVDDVPAAWNEKYEKLLGVDVPNDANGCLQDVHWSMGSFGYFPSYALGNLYAAQFWAAIQRDQPDIMIRLTAGETEPILDWLTSHVHVHGSRYTPTELVQKATGSPLDPVWYEKYLREKYAAIYGF